MQVTKPPAKIYLLFMLVILAWGLSWPANKIGLQYSSSIWFAALRLILGTACIFLVLMGSRLLRLPARCDIVPIVVIGLMQIGLFMVLIVTGLRYVPAGRSAMLVYSTPLWVTPMAWWLFKEPFTIIKALGFFLGMAGILLLFNPWEFDWHNQHVVLGNSMLLLAALSWAVSILYTRFVYWHSSPLVLIPWQLLMAAIPVTILAYCIEPEMPVVWTPVFMLVLGYSAIFATAFGYWGVIEISKALPATTTSLGLLGTPLIGLLSAAIFLDERLTTTMWIAMSLIIAGLFCLVRARP